MIVMPTHLENSCDCAKNSYDFFSVCKPVCREHWLEKSR